MASGKIRVGNTEVLICSDGILEPTLEVHFPSVSAEQMAPYFERYPETKSAQGNLVDPMGFFILRSGGKTILVDTGIGPGPVEAFRGIQGCLPDELEQQGVRADEIDIVVLTHLHPDHVGWNLATDGKPFFPKARYVTSQTDWDFFSNPETWKLFPFPYLETSVMPLQELGVLDLVTGEHSITSEITTMPTPGHTPGHISLLIVSAGERGIVLGDVSGHPAQVTEPNWVSGFDTDPDLARETRKRVHDRIEAEGMTVMAGHFPTRGVGKFVRLEGRRYWQAL